MQGTRAAAMWSLLPKPVTENGEGLRGRRQRRGAVVVTNYLQCLVAFEVFRVEAASRRYRDSFTPKYMTLWPGRSRQLQVDVVEASIQQVIYMNGHAYELGPTADHLAGCMRACGTSGPSWAGC